MSRHPGCYAGVLVGRASGVLMGMLCYDPFIFTVEGALTDFECEHFRKIASNSPNMIKSTVAKFDKKTNKRGLLSDVRTSSHCWVSHSHDQITKDVGNRISGLVRAPLSHAEFYNVLHYAEGQEYQPHFDTFDPFVDDNAHYLKNGGQRIITVIAYLNDVEQGGETKFPAIDKIVIPKKGKVVVFHDCYKGTDKRHPDSLHGGLPVIKGEKWAFNLWFRKYPRKHYATI
jgi:prolyl 4-hydroxylase